MLFSFIFEDILQTKPNSNEKIHSTFVIYFFFSTFTNKSIYRYMEHGKNGSVSAVLYVNEGVIQFTKRGGSDLVPKETILTKLY